MECKDTIINLKIALDQEYAIRVGVTYPFLMHHCNEAVFREYHYIEETGARVCVGCHKITPPKILFIYKLWKFHNG